MAAVAACINLGAAARDKRELDRARGQQRDEASFARDGITPEESDGQRKDRIEKLSQEMRGVPIGWLVDFIISNDFWEMETQDVCNSYIIIWFAITSRGCSLIGQGFLSHSSDSQVYCIKQIPKARRPLS